MSTPKSSPLSYFDVPTEPMVNPIWGVRFFAFATLLLVALALLIFKSGGAHNFCLGGAAGLLLGMIVLSFSVRSITMKTEPRSSGVDTNLNLGR